jgi:hypothetical protein
LDLPSIGAIKKFEENISWQEKSLVHISIGLEEILVTVDLIELGVLVEYVCKELELVLLSRALTP